MVMIVSVGGVSPSQTKEHWQRGAQANKVFYSEDESTLCRLRRLGGVREISPGAALTKTGAGTPTVLHILTPAT